MHIYAYILATSLRYKFETFFQTADVCLGVFSRNNRQNMWLIYTGLARRKVLPTVLVGGGGRMLKQDQRPTAQLLFPQFQFIIFSQSVKLTVI